MYEGKSDKNVINKRYKQKVEAISCQATYHKHRMPTFSAVLSRHLFLNIPISDSPTVATPTVKYSAVWNIQYMCIYKTTRQQSVKQILTPSHIQTNAVPLPEVAAKNFPALHHNRCFPNLTSTFRIN